MDPGVIVSVVIGIAGLIVAVLTFMLGRAYSRLDKAEEAAKHFEDSYNTLKSVVDRFGITADIGSAILRAVQTKSEAKSP